MINKYRSRELVEAIYLTKNNIEEVSKFISPNDNELLEYMNESLLLGDPAFILKGLGDPVYVTLNRWVVITPNNKLFCYTDEGFKELYE